MTEKLDWLRLWTDFPDDPKVQLLDFGDQRHYVVLLCLKRAGILDASYSSPELRERIVARKLGLAEDKAAECRRRLREVDLIGEDWQPLGWGRRQFESDSSTDRVRRHRAKRAAAGLPQQNYITPSVREAVFERDGHACVACGAANDLTIDHKVSELSGGTNEPDNLQTLCRQCNASKRDHDNGTFMKRSSNGLREQSQNQKAESEGAVVAGREGDTGENTLTLTPSPDGSGPQPTGPIVTRMFAKSKRSASTATRLPDPYEFTDEHRAYAESEGLTDPAREFQRFVDHFRSAGGQNARKHDWMATWRNWCRRAADGQQQRTAPRPTRYEQTQQRLREAMNRARD